MGQISYSSTDGLMWPTTPSQHRLLTPPLLRALLPGPLLLRSTQATDQGGKDVLEEFAVPAGTSPTWSWPGHASLCVRGSVLPRAHTEASDLTLQCSPDTRDRDLPACHLSSSLGICEHLESLH